MLKRLIGLVIGISCVVVGIVILASHFKAQKTQTAETTSTVVRVESQIETDSDGIDSVWYYPVVKYTVDGKDYETRIPSTGSTNSKEYKEGQEIVVKYNPNKPEEVSPKGSKGGLIGGIAFILMGVVATGVTVFKRF